jgi:DNA-binding response OmpR family regulator
MKRILLVDDNESFRRPLAEILRNYGYEVHTADEGSAALKLFQSQRFDLVVTDLIMPGKEGVETIMELRRLEPDVKIIAISGGGRIDANDYLATARMLGAARTLVKPFDVTEILEAMGSLLDERE